MTEQEKREKVIKGLECCKTIHPDCDHCPYFNTDTERLGRAMCKAAGRPDDDLDMFCLALLHCDVLALLKAQEPRVMTLGQVRDEADHMYLEKHSKTGSDLYGCAIRGDWDGYGIELLMSEYDTARERWSDYGERWRCWTSRPTDEQREAIPWN